MFTFYELFLPVLTQDILLPRTLLSLLFNVGECFVSCQPENIHRCFSLNADLDFESDSGDLS